MKNETRRSLIRILAVAVASYALATACAGFLAFGQVTPGFSNPARIRGVRTTPAKNNFNFYDSHGISNSDIVATLNSRGGLTLTSGWGISNGRGGAITAKITRAGALTVTSCTGCGGGVTDPYTPPSGTFTVHGLEAFPDVAGAYPPSYGLTFGPAGDTQWQTFVGDAGTTLYNYTTGAANQYKWAYGGAVKMGLAPNAGGNVLTVVSPSGAADRIVIGGSTLRGDGSAAFNSAVISGTITMDSFTANAPSTVAAGQYLRNDTHLPSTAGGDIKFDDSAFNRMMTLHDAGATGDMTVTGAATIDGALTVASCAGCVPAGRRYLSLTTQNVVAGTVAYSSKFDVNGEALAPVKCRWTGDTAGTGVNACHLELYDVTTATALCTVTYAACSSAVVGDTQTCTASGTAAIGDIVALEADSGATTNTPRGTMVCSY